MKLADIAVKAKEYIGEDNSRFSILAESSLQKMEDISESVEKKLKMTTDNSGIQILDEQRKASLSVISDLK